MTVKDLKEALADVPDDAVVLFQGNVKGEEDSEDGDDMTYTTCLGSLFSAWLRTPQNEFVLDCAITESE